MTKSELTARLYKIAGECANDVYNYIVKDNDWKKETDTKKYDRTYLSIAETSPDRKASKHYKVMEYGYWDNIEQKYVAGKNDLSAEKVYNFCGARVNA